MKTFLQALELCRVDAKKAKTFLKDKRLTQIEKCIIEGYLFLRDNDAEMAVERLSSLKSIDKIVEAKRLLILGRAYLDLSRYQKAITELEASLNLDESFDAYHNLFITYLNLKNINEMEQILEKMLELKLDSEIDKLSIKKCEFCLLAMTQNYAKADAFLIFLKKNFPKMSEAQAICVLVDIFDYQVKKDDFKAAEATLQDMKKFRKFQSSANYNFMKLMLNHIQNSAPLWINDSDFDPGSVLFFQIKCIQKLEQGNRDEATYFWQLLKKDYPELYQDDFCYKGDKNLFTLALEKHQTIQVKTSLQKVPGLSKLQHFVEALKNRPYSKEELYAFVYEKEYLDKSDLLKLQQLASRARAELGLEVEYLQGCYRLKALKKAM